MKIISTKLTGIVMNIRDQLKADALKLRLEGFEIMKEAEDKASAILTEAKKRKHVALISANKMEREAQVIQEALNQELELEVKTNQEVSAAWDCKSQARLAAEMLSSAPAELRQTSVRLADSELLELGLLKTGDK